ncbi:MAG: anthranilate synthase component II [Chitinophagales bacterium]
MSKILVLDNYDSFTYNLVHYITNVTQKDIDVFFNDKIELQQIAAYDKILLSPGPGLPHEAGILNPLIEKYATTKSILGVCLGLQAITEVFGGTLQNLEKVYHGVASNVHVISKNELLFKNIPSNFRAGRYHSWIAHKKNLPKCLEITAEDENGQIMALRHQAYDLRAVQFHPESILTEYGQDMIYNWLMN